MTPSRTSWFYSAVSTRQERKTTPGSFATASGPRGPPAPPGLSPRLTHTMAYDPRFGRVVLVGGVDQAGVRFRDTWILKNNTWTELPTEPAVRFGPHAIAYDAARGSMVLLDAGAWEASFWLLTGDVWAPDLVRFTPGIEEGSALVYEPTRNRTVLFGGINSRQEPRNATYVLDGDVWTVGPTAPETLMPRMGHAMVYDSRRDRVVLFGGKGGASDAATRYNDTWFFVNDKWEKGPEAPQQLTPRADHAMVYDSNLDRVLLFGGHDGAQRNDTWFLAGDTWIQGPAAPADLTGRSGHAMAYDGKRRRVVLFGGEDDLGAQRDTWQFENGNWRKGPEAPSKLAGRWNHGMTFDDHAGQVVLMGGLIGFNSYISDTWTLGDGTWQEHPAPIGGSPKAHTLTFDAGRRRMVASTGLFTEFTRYQHPFQVQESCVASVDDDGDTLRGCDDPDCWGYCQPLCPPYLGEDCPANKPFCGDGVCDPVLESCHNCPADCDQDPSPAHACVECGDSRCSGSETAANCPGDCA